MLWQQSNLRASLKKQDEQGELVRRVAPRPAACAQCLSSSFQVSEQVQTVQQKLIGKEVEIKRLHEVLWPHQMVLLTQRYFQENLKAASELRTMREEQASWGGQLDLAQTKYGLAEKELRARDAAMVEVLAAALEGGAH